MFGMALSFAVPASARSSSVQILPHVSTTIRLPPLLRRRRPAGNLNLALAVRRNIFVCSLSSSSPPSPSSSTVSPPKQVDESQDEARGDTMAWGKVSAVLFDMDGVLCNSEQPSRLAAVSVFAELGVSVTADDFVPFMGTGEAKFLGGVASVKGVKGFDPEKAKKRFFEIYLDKYAKPNSGIGFPGALELIVECKRKGLKVAVASSADRLKVDANLAAAGLPTTLLKFGLVTERKEMAEM
ncbi:hypothetical protein KSP39_PZI023840 [Platanthera zijinensis]|uniref:Uncharacterized protein n=1 Tax=Platanthera zijinensis TaxID=2320716 RepID=A0AAP0ATU3_9ASPA